MIQGQSQWQDQLIEICENDNFTSFLPSVFKTLGSISVISQYKTHLMEKCEHQVDIYLCIYVASKKKNKLYIFIPEMY